MNWKTIGYMLGRLLIFIAAAMLTPFLIAIFLKEQAILAFGVSIILVALTGFVLLWAMNKEGRLGFKEGCTVVTLGWLLAAIFGSLPYSLAGVTPFFLDALFESMSGFTTTGATIFKDVEQLPQSIIFWRSLTQWLGGMGIIVLFIAVLPNMGNTSFQLFKAEFPGPVAERVKPRIQDTARILWLIYVSITVAEIVALLILGLPFLDAVNHSLSTIASGGFSSQNASVGHFADPAVEYTIAFFMVLAGVNFTLYYYFLKNGFKYFFRNSEFKLYLTIIAITTVLIAINLCKTSQYETAVAIRHAFFQVASIITTTGFALADYDKWPEFSKYLLFLLMFVGGSAGSTAGGVKVARHLILFKNILLQLKQILHPKAVYSIRLNGQPFSSKISNTVLHFLYVYILIFAAATAYMSAIGLNYIEAISSVAAALGNVGPGFGAVGPSGSYADIPPSGKGLLTFLMLLGRLELYTVLILLLPEFWGVKLKNIKRSADESF